MDCSPNEIALAWLRSRASILTPICGFRTLFQLEKSIRMLSLSGADLKVLNNFSPRKIILRE
jgi:aryl-alcohol dehydrogenase-like predicted oxidoreductase